MKYTIIIPHYNDYENICRLITSIPKNDCFEVIIIDDNSPEQTFENLATYTSKYPNVKLMKNSTNVRGAGKCRNIGLTYASGDWLFFADSDDMFSENFFSTIKDYVDSNYDIIYFNPVTINSQTLNKAERGSHLSDLVIKYLNTPNINNEWSLRLNFPNPWSKMIRREFVQKNNLTFDETIKSNDVMFSTKIGVLAKEITADKRSIYKWIIRRGSMTSTVSKEIFNVNVNVALNRVEYLQNVLENSQFKNARFNFFVYICKSLFIYRFGINYTMSLIKKMISIGAPLLSMEVTPYKLTKKYFEAKHMTQVKR